MTVIRPNSIAGITSIAALGDNISFYNSDGVNISHFNANINATSGVSTIANLTVGFITATSTSITGNVIVGGNVSIAGTLTYEDVTNVDSIGIVTARAGVNVTGGSVVINSGGLNVSGVTTVAAGSSGAPSVSPTGDSNTGIFFPAEDTIAFTEGGTESARFDSSGRLLIRTTSARTVAELTPELEVETANGFPSFSITANTTTAGQEPRIVLGRSKGSSIGSNTVVASGDSLGSIRFAGADGSDLNNTAASIGCEVDGTPGTDDMPGRLIFSTTADGASSPTERMRIDSSGRLGLGITNPSETLHVAGNMRVGTGVGSGNTIHFSRSGQTDAARIACDANSNLAFHTNAAERARIDSSGRILVGTTSARANFGNSTESAALQLEGTDANRRLSITGADNAAVAILARQRSGAVGGNTVLNNGDLIGVTRFEGSDGSEFVVAAQISAEVDGTPGANDMPGRLVFSTTADGASSPTERCRISNSGGFSLGTTANPGAGAIFATGDITAFYSSDIRLKKDIEPISEPIKKLMEISGVTYKWNEEYLKDKDVDGYFVRETEVGVIAQEVEKVLPEVVATRENGYKAVRYEKLVALLIEAVKDQQHQIDELKARLEEK